MERETFFWPRLVKGQIIAGKRCEGGRELHVYSLMCGLFIDSLSLIVNSLFSAVCTVLDYRESDEESVVDPPTLTIVSASLPLHTSHSSPHTV